MTLPCLSLTVNGSVVLLKGREGLFRVILAMLTLGQEEILELDIEGMLRVSQSDNRSSLAWEQALRGALAAGREKVGKLATTCTCTWSGS